MVFIFSIYFRIVYAFILNYKCENLAIIGIIIAFTIFNFKLSLPLWCGNVSLGLFYYWLGNKMCHVQNERYVYIPYIILFIIAVFVYNSPGSFLENKADSVTHYVVYVGSSLVGVIAFNNFSRLLPIFEKLRLYIVGKYSMVFYVTHGIISKIVDLLLALFDIDMNCCSYYVLFTILFVILMGIVVWSLTMDRIKWCVGM